MNPVNVHIFDGFLPSFCIVVERNAHNVESFFVIFLIVFFHVGHLCSARSAPRCPEVYQNIVSLAAIFAQLVRFAVYIVQSKVDELRADDFRLLFLLFQHSFCFCNRRVIDVGVFRIEQFFELGVINSAQNIIDEHRRDDVVFIVFHHLQSIVERGSLQIVELLLASLDERFLFFVALGFVGNDALVFFIYLLSGRVDGVECQIVAIEFLIQRRTFQRHIL